MLVRADGLRTLVLAYADLSEGQYGEWSAKFSEASQAIGNRQQKMEVSSFLQPKAFAVGLGCGIAH